MLGFALGTGAPRANIASDTGTPQANIASDTGTPQSMSPAWPILRMQKSL